MQDKIYSEFEARLSINSIEKQNMHWCSLALAANWKKNATQEITISISWIEMRLSL